MSSLANFFKKLSYRNIYLVSIGLLIISIPLSKFTTTMASFAILGVWLAERDFKHKLQNIWEQKSSILWVLFLLWHFVGLLYSEDYHYAWNDIKTKVPLLFGLLFASYPRFSQKQFRFFLTLYVLAIFVGTLISSYLLYVKGITDTRHITYISHIRFSLNVCFSICILFYWIVFEKQHFSFQNLICGFGIIWFVFYLISLRSSTGLVAFSSCFITSLLYFSFQTKKYYIKYSFISLAILLPLGGILLFSSAYSTYSKVDKIDFSKLDTVTALGNRYTNDTVRFPVENGKYVGLYISDDELQAAWNKKSNVDFLGKDANGQEIRFTIIRYLNSKGLRKDAQGVNALTDADVEAIKLGFTSEKLDKQKGLTRLLEEFIWGYKMYVNSGNPNGSSLMQRYEYFKVSLHLIKENWIYGTGTGDIQLAFNRYYEKTNSPLFPELRLRSHNQFLSTFITFGVLGILLLLFSLIYPPLANRQYSNYLFLMFFVITVVSFLSDDMLETQAGVTFFAFFTALLLFARPLETEKKQF